MTHHLQRFKDNGIEMVRTYWPAIVTVFIIAGFWYRLNDKVDAYATTTDEIKTHQAMYENSQQQVETVIIDKLTNFGNQLTAATTNIDWIKQRINK